MQEESKDAKSGRFRRVYNASTPEPAKKNLLDTMLPNARSTTSRRITMMYDDVILKQKEKITTKKIAAKRQSIMPLQMSLDVQKKTDIESRKELELEFLYDEYLQTTIMNLITKKRLAEKEQLMIARLATVARELDQDTEKLIRIKKRERDITDLCLVQQEIDAQIAAVTKHTKDKTFKTVKTMLSKLQSLLEPLDVLRCNGIILPETQEEWQDTREKLMRCSSTLKNIMNLIESKGEAYCAISAGLKDFVETHNEMENLQKKLEEALCNLQILVLKNASFSLIRSDNWKPE